MASPAITPPQNYNSIGTMFFDENNKPASASNAAAIRSILEGHQVSYTPRPGDGILISLIRKQMEREGRTVHVPAPTVCKPKPVTIPPVPVPYKGQYASRMQEWSHIRAASKPTNAAKFFADKLNDAHNAFLADELGLDEYISEVFGFLEDRASSDDVFSFLHSIEDKLADKRFCPESSRTKFASKLNTAWKAWEQSQGISTFSVEDQEQEEAIADDPAPIIGCKATVSVGEKSIRAAYDNYVAKVPDAETHLIGLSLQYVRRTIRSSMENLPEGMADFEDVSSKLIEKIWQSLPAFRGDSLAFFKWVNKVQKNAGIDGVRQTKRETGNKVPLLVEFEDGDIEQNPLIDRQQKQQYIRKLPDWIQGTDLMICGLIRDGRTYAEIGKFCHISEAAVKERVAKMKKRNLEETKASGVVKRIRVRGEWVDSISKPK